MGLLDETRYIERQQFFNGQRLFAEDLQDIEAFNREMRWLHNRSLHQPGIGNGFAVRGQKGDRIVKVEPGYVLDALGREIVLTETQEIHVPPVAGEKDGSPVFYDLVVSYPDDKDLEQVETRAGVCAKRGVVRLREQPVFCWVRLKRTETGSPKTVASEQKADVKSNLIARDTRLGAEIESGHRIVIARAEVLNCQLNRGLSLSERRSARPPTQPNIACGEVKPEWQVIWFIDRDMIKELIISLLTRREKIDLENMLASLFVAATSSTATKELAAISIGEIPLAQLLLLTPYILPFGLKATIDTSQGCFTTTPCYCARIEGSRTNAIDLTELQESSQPEPSENLNL